MRPDSSLHKLIGLVLLGLAFTAMRSTVAQENLSSVSFVKGECKVELAGADLACTGIVTYSNFKNGRELFNFPVADKATVAVAGPTLEPAKDGKVTLRIDHIYINKDLIEADGQCAIQPPSGGSNKTGIECSAALRDGRKLAASFSSDQDWKAIVGNLKTPGEVSSAADDECADIVKFQGFLTRAQSQCGYKFRSDSFQQKAKQCASRTSQQQTDDINKAGMSSFDRNEQERGHAKVCADVLKDFSDILRK
jgi:hypothetical protein